MKYFQLIVFSLITTIGFSQDGSEEIRMVDFSPQTGAYNIYYPNTYVVKESDSTGSNIVTISNHKSGLNITISSYEKSKNVKDSDLMEVFDGFLGGIKISDWKSYKSKFDVLIEGKVTENGIHWIWYGISLKKKLIILSVNKEEEVSEEETNLIRFMIDNLEIH